MAIYPGLHSDLQRERFLAAAREVRRGGARSKICGARTRGGGTCGQPPLVGGTRCLRHGGPHAARAHRQRQLEAVAKGKLSHEDFARHEARRAVNALRNGWRRHPWTPGQTIDLGEHEDRFQTLSGLARLDTPVAPSVLDWLRWKYRRLQVDRRRDDEWARVVFDEYPRRVRDAGPPPPTYDPSQPGLSRPMWTAEPPPHWSRRNRADGPREAAGDPVPVIRPAEEEHDPAALAMVAYEQREVLTPLLELCGTAREQKSVIVTLKSYLDRPGDPAAMRRWLDTVSALRSRV